jgi:hypothetical protein
MPRYTTKVANGTIYPGVFCKIDPTTTYGGVIQAVTGDKIFGIVGPDTHTIPFGALDDGIAAVAGYDVLIYDLGDGPDHVLMKVGAGGWTAGDLLMPDNNAGSAATAITWSAGSSNYYGARALATCPAGVWGPVEGVFGFG